MLQEVSIAGVASYSAAGQKLEGLKPVNYIFGTNGSGKTTISRVINDVESRSTCSLTWTAGRPLECLVYNIDFVTTHFAQQMPGIFTLGKTEKDTLDKIKIASARVGALYEEIAKLEGTLGAEDNSSGKREELQTLRRGFEVTAWEIKTTHDPHFEGAFAGVRNSKSRFCDRILEEWASNSSAVIPLDDLRKKAQTVFAKGLERIEPLNPVDLADLIALETTPVLVKKVVGKDDIDIAALISRLGNSDWVRQGMAYAEQSGLACPYCQQDIPTDLAYKLNEYFDETYLNDLAAIQRTCDAYAVMSDIVIERLEAIAASGNVYLDTASFSASFDRLKSKVRINLSQLDRKRSEPSTSITLEMLMEVSEAVNSAIAEVNFQVAKHNSMVDNLALERSTLISQIWKCLMEGSRASFLEYDKKRSDLEKAISKLTAGLVTKREELAQAHEDLARLEKGVTSVQPTVTEINAILRSFGFTGFKLATAGEHENKYEIIRGDGSEAATTLSEGERSFITFLYFYHLINGSTRTSGINTDRVVVFDDPVSSLDSDVLFIVSALIRRVVEEARAGTGQIKQVFVLTHNIYFHKEVSFDAKRQRECLAHETFWVVRKNIDESSIVRYNLNPISTSYELLWNEVRSPDRGKTTIQNTLRRILENYFKIMGNIDKDKIVMKFEGRDQQICGALFSWMNDGSHGFNDDLYISSDDTVIARYLDVFQRIFEVTDHTAHYEMMMGREALPAMAQAQQLEPTDAEGSEA
jgi:wobble nucleotide-excising tRNase